MFTGFIVLHYYMDIVKWTNHRKGDIKMYKYLILLFAGCLSPLVYADELSNPVVIDFIKDGNNGANTTPPDICDGIKCPTSDS